ncbi:MAG: DUF1311 domain-containing protein [Lachnospiraceae bacterium]|nr:DUF1311 domain-containing protein [Lachnospiraceae bacterium]
MKKLMGFILLLVCVLAMVGCNNKSMDYIIDNKPSVTGIVEEVRGDYIIMYSDSAEGYPNGSRWSISLAVETKDSYTDLVVGDEIVVYHDGNVMESDPLQVGTVYAITLKTPVDRVDETEQENATEILGEEENAVESIQEEIARVEEQSREHCDIDSSNMGQQEMNYHSAQWYKLWDDELNSLWSRLSDELDAETKARVLEEQRAWIKRKEGNATAAGVQALGGSLQPLLESETAAEMTRARVYVLAGYLAEVRNESFTISPEIQESLDAAGPNLDDVFAQFEGQWIFDESRGACVGVERTENCAYGVEGSNWTVWVTGGDLFSDLDVYGYTEQNILFKVTHADSEAFYELSFGMEGNLCLTYRKSLSIEAANDYDIIVCE